MIFNQQAKLSILDSANLLQKTIFSERRLLKLEKTTNILHFTQKKSKEKAFFK